MKEITDTNLAAIRSNLSACNPLVQSLVVRLDRVEGENAVKETTILALSLKADSWETAAHNAQCRTEAAELQVATLVREVEEQKQKVKLGIRLLSEYDYTYNQNTNALIKRHAEQLTALRERMKRMEEALEVIARQNVAERSIAGQMVRDAQAALKEVGE